MDISLFVIIATTAFAALYSLVIEKVEAFQNLDVWGKRAIVVAGNLLIASAIVLDACYTHVLDVLLYQFFQAVPSCPTNVAGTILAVFVVAVNGSQAFHYLYNKRKE